MSASNRDPAVPPQRGVLLASGDFLFRWRRVLFPAAWLGVLLILHPWIPFGTALADGLVDAAGILLVLAGQALRSATIGSAGAGRVEDARTMHSGKLLSTGPYRALRNPLYLGTGLIHAGLLVVFNNPWGYTVVGGGFVLVLIAIVAAEEAYLRRTFGQDYDTYCREVPRWWPGWPRLQEVARGLRPDWALGLAADYRSWGAWMVVLLAFLAYEHAIRIGGRPEFPILAAFVGAGVVVLLLALAARGAIRHGKLGA